MQSVTPENFWNAIPATFAWEPSDFRLSTWSEHVPFAFWIVDKLRPRSIVELGTWHGMSYLAFCQAVQRLGLKATTVAVDTWQGDSQAGLFESGALASLRSVHDRKYGTFSTLRQADFDTANAQTEDGSVDLLHVDGLHTYEAVRHDFETWLPKMSERGVVLFHDTQERRDDFGVYRFWAEVSADYPNFEFHHEHGLGVLGVGKQLPADVAALLNLSPGSDQAGQVRATFERLGAGVRAQQTVIERNERMSKLKAHPVIKAALAMRRLTAWAG